MLATPERPACLCQSLQDRKRLVVHERVHYLQCDSSTKTHQQTVNSLRLSSAGINVGERNECAQGHNTQQETKKEGSRRPVMS
jgi:hypothetical protein